MSTIEDGQAVYQPFPSFVDWFTGPFDSTVVDRYGELLSLSRSAANEQQLKAALNIATRYAAVDTGAIEGLYTVDRGFTRTIATQAATWQAALEARGAHVSNAIQDALGAYEYVLDATKNAVPLTEMWIREVHTLLCASQSTYIVYTQHGADERPLPKGSYKTMPNSPTNASTGRVHAYAPVTDTAPEMARLLAELRTEAFQSAHPVLQAAYSHYAYVCIHPFADGNGRVARALASVYLYRAPGVPLVIFADQRDEYLDSLEAADGGNTTPFVAFIEQRTVDAIGIVRISLSKSASLADSLAAITAFYAVKGLSPELIAAAQRLRSVLSAAYQKQVASLKLPPQLQITPVNMNLNSGPMAVIPEGYAEFGSEGDLMLRAHSAWPVAIDTRHGSRILVRADNTAPSDVLIFPNSGDPLEIWFREIAPSVTQSLKLRLDTWAETQLGNLLEAVARLTAGPSSNPDD